NVALNRILGSIPVHKLSGKIRGSGGIDRVRADLDLRLASAQYGVIDASSSLQWKQQVVRIKTLELQRAKSDSSITAKGKLHLSDQPMRMNLQAHWQHISYPFNKNPFVTSPSGQVRLDGSLNNPMARILYRQ